MPFAVILRTTLVVVAVCAGYLPAQSTLTRFFILPDQSPNAGSESMFTGIEATTQTPYAFDFTEDLRYDRGAFVTLSQDPGNPSVWNVVDFHLTATDPALGSQVVFSRPRRPGRTGPSPARPEHPSGAERLSRQLDRQRLHHGRHHRDRPVERSPSRVRRRSRWVAWSCPASTTTCFR